MKMEKSSWENKINDVKYIEKIRLLCWAPCIIYSKQTEKRYGAVRVSPWP